MGIEIDVLPIGTVRAGDAILLRYGNLAGPRDQQRIVLIDGGYTGDGQMVLDHLEDEFRTDEINLVINTHPDRDYISRLTAVLENARVGCLLMHDPDNNEPIVWKGSALAPPMPFLAHMQKSLSQARSLIETARSHRVSVVQPFTGLSAGSIHVLGPTDAYYSELLASMTREPRAGAALAHGETELLLKHAGSAEIGTRAESLYEETLPATGSTSPSNNTSVITLLAHEGINVLFTGDAGPTALQRANDELRARGIGVGDLDLVQVPHHGSRYNVTPAVLDDLLGPITATQRGIAFVSVAEKDATLQFPARQTTNAFRRRGYPVLDTSGRCLTFTYGAGTREDELEPVEPLPLYNRVHIFES